MTTNRINFDMVSNAAKLAERWMRSEMGVLRLGGLYFDIEVRPENLATRSDYDVVVMPLGRPGPRTRVATLHV